MTDKGFFNLPEEQQRKILKKTADKANKAQRDFMTEEDLKKCFNCGKPMVNAVDPITGEVSEYLFRYDCDCSDKDIILSIG